MHSGMLYLVRLTAVARQNVGSFFSFSPLSSSLSPPLLRPLFSPPGDRFVLPKVS